MATGAHIRMNMARHHMTTDLQMLTLAQWFSPAYPLGAFAYSHGLETAIQQGNVATANDLVVWLRGVLEHGAGRNDCILMCAAYRCDTDAELRDVADHARAFCCSAERLRETELQGAAFCQTTSAISQAKAEDLPLPVAIGSAARQHDLPLETTAAMYLHSFTSNLISAAVRLVPLGQTEGQKALFSLAPLCKSIASQSLHSTLADLSGLAFLSDIASMKHETLEPRIFRS